jgi:ADP-ribose diphosphatase
VDDLPPLPPPPAIAVAVAREAAAPSAKGGFVDLRRLELVVTFPGGEKSAPFAYDIATRVALDAVVMVAHFTRQGVRHVFLRSAVRPALALRPLPPALSGCIWELPAGLVDPGETPREAAARELEEELGFSVAPEALYELGNVTVPAPGLIGELHIFFHVEVDPTRRAPPTEDGSALERGAAICTLPLKAALEHCRSGAILDAKTELALRRLSELP